jgi:hypothetical protein
MLTLIKNIGKIEGVDVDTIDFSISPESQIIRFTWLDFKFCLHIYEDIIEVQKNTTPLTSIFWSPKDGKLHNGAANLSKIDRMLIDQITKIILLMNDNKRHRIIMGDAKVSYNGYEIKVGGPYVIAIKDYTTIGCETTRVLYKSIFGEITETYICGEFYEIARFIRNNFEREVK